MFSSRLRGKTKEAEISGCAKISFTKSAKYKVVSIFLLKARFIYFYQKCCETGGCARITFVEVPNRYPH